MRASDTIGTPEHRRLVMDFLNAIGLPIEFRPRVNGFLRKIKIEGGRMYIQEDCPVSNILHEGGHLATCPAQYRSRITGNVESSLRGVFAETEHLHPDAPLIRALVNMSDQEATAWAWAIGVRLRLPPSIVIRDHEYQRSGKSVRFQLAFNNFPGINGLRAADMCVMRGPNAYPVLQRLTQPILDLRSAK